MGTFNLTIITPQGKAFDEDVVSITAPGTEGSFGILAKHTPLVATLKKGILVIKKEGGDLFFKITEGTLEVNTENKVLVLVGFAEKSSSLEEAKSFLKKSEAVS